MSTISIDKQKCTKCGLCAEICSIRKIIQQNGGYPQIKQGNCHKCGHCIAICPNAAISNNELNINRFLPISYNGINGQTMLNFLSSKRSTRHYSNKPIDKELLDELLKAAAMAPSAKNRQWRSFIVLQNREKIQELERLIIGNLRKMYGFLKLMNTGIVKKLIRDPYMIEFLEELVTDLDFILNQDSKEKSYIFYNAPCLVFSYAWHDNGMTGDKFAKEHCTMAMDYLMLQAQAMGLGSCIIGYAQVAEKIFRKYLNLPRGYKVYNVITLGYPRYMFRKTVHRELKDVIRL
jgi:nitroreductase/Pyruvate/2-oxoacid:ferredoxin oxidoreductase delta subunit